MKIKCTVFINHNQICLCSTFINYGIPSRHILCVVLMKSASPDLIQINSRWRKSESCEVRRNYKRGSGNENKSM